MWTVHTSPLLSERPHAPASVRAQTALVRTLADALERAAPASPLAHALREQLDEELRRLSFHIEETSTVEP